MYAKTMAGDRDLRLSGYEVYRFGGYELSAGRALHTLAGPVPHLRAGADSGLPVPGARWLGGLRSLAPSARPEPTLTIAEH